MLDFLNMTGNHEERQVDNYEGENGLVVDTCAVTDADLPYETGITHPRYNEGKWVIVELYPTKEQAQEGHKKWVKIMTTEPLPESLRDASTATIAKACDVLGEDWRDKKAQVET